MVVWLDLTVGVTQARGNGNALLRSTKRPDTQSDYSIWGKLLNLSRCLLLLSGTLRHHVEQDLGFSVWLGSFVDLGKAEVVGGFRVATQLRLRVASSSEGNQSDSRVRLCYRCCSRCFPKLLRFCRKSRQSRLFQFLAGWQRLNAAGSLERQLTSFGLRRFFRAVSSLLLVVGVRKLKLGLIFDFGFSSSAFQNSLYGASL